MVFFVQCQLDFIQIMGEVFFCNIVELEVWQCSDGVVQWVQEQFVLQLVVVGWCVVEISVVNVKGDVGIWCDWCGLWCQVQGYVFWYKVFNVEILFVWLIVVGVGVNVLYVGSCVVVEWISKLVQVIYWFVYY